MNERWSLDLMRRYGEAMLRVRQEGGPDAVVETLLGFQAVAGELDEDSAAAVGFHARVLADWAECGFASIRCAPRLGESLMTSKVPAEAIPEMLAPWQTTLIELPANTLVCHDLTAPNGWSQREYFHWVIVQNFPTDDPRHLAKGIHTEHCNWVVWPMTAAAGLQAPLKIRSVAEMVWQAENIEAQPGDMFGNRVAPEVRHAATDTEAVASTAGMMLWFIIGCLMELNADHVRGELQRHKRYGAKKRRDGGPPKGWVFKLTRPVRVDVREYVRLASERGERAALTVQRLVRGHWKNQPHGHERSERRFIHIEPYWRGPEDAPIAVSPHIIKPPPKKLGDEGNGTPEAAE